MAVASDHSLLCWGAVDSTGAQWASGKFLHQGPPCRSLWLFVDKSRSRSIFRCTRGVNVDSFSVDYPILKSSTFGCTEISPGLPWVGYWGSREKGHDRAREGNGEWSSHAQCSPLYTETSASFNSGSSSTWDCGLSFQFLCKITKWEAPLCRLSKGKSFRWERRYLRVLVPLRKRRLHEISAALLEIVPLVLLCLFYLFASSPSVFCLSF